MRAISGILMTLLFIGMLTSVCYIQPVKAGGTIYIRADGSVYPPTANITSVDNVTYTFTDTIYDEVVVKRSNIIIDGDGYTLQGPSESGLGFNLTNVSNVTIQNTNIKDFDHGVWFSSSNNNTVSGNNITNNGNGIYLDSSLNNTISRNKIENNDSGVSLFDSSSHNIFFENNITNWEDGIYLDTSSHNNTFCENNITNNSVGVLVGSSDNEFYHNNFIDNIQQVSILTPGCTNSWNDSYPSGGNHWSDYAGVDLYSGRYQNETGSDGIGDTPYTIDANNQDHYPLISPYIYQRNIAVTNVTASKTIVGQGYSTYINVTVENQGDLTETFNVTTYYNSDVINYTTITNLPSGEETTVTFTWDTTGVPKGSYTIKARATPVPGETDTADNTVIDGIVQVVIPGDVNADGTCNMKDIYQLIRRYMCSQGQPCYVANCDINCDGTINMKDIYLAIRHFGETYP